MSKSSGTATVTTEQQWALMAEADNAVPAEAETSPDTVVDEKEPDTTESAVQTPETDEPDAPVEPAETDDAAAPPVRRWWSRPRVRRVGLLLLVVIAVAAVAATAVLGWKVKHQSDIDAAADQAEQTARNYAVALTSVSSDNLDQNFADVLGGATGEFKDMYSQSSGQLRQLLVDNKATAQGTVIDSGIKSASTDKVEVLLFVDQTVTNTATPDPRVDRSRVVMTMEKVDGRWLAAKVDLP